MSRHGLPPTAPARGCDPESCAIDYAAPWWLPGGNTQTLWAATAARRNIGPAPGLQRERWLTPDADFIDVDGFAGPAGAPLLVLFHGLEGSSRSHYAQALAGVAQDRGWAFASPHFRGCSGEINLAPRAYHSGDFAEVDWIMRRLHSTHIGPIYAVGVSLGGNALLRWAEEAGQQASTIVQAVAAVCAPLDLTASGHAIGRGFNRLLYTRLFLRSMVPRALAKLTQYPGLFDRDALLRARDLHAFDNVFTAPLHGFRDVEDYWRRASAKPQLPAIRVPTLVLNTLNDTFVPASSLPTVRDVGSHVMLAQPPQGGHVGFPAGRFPGHVQTMPQQVCAWLAGHA